MFVVRLDTFSLLPLQRRVATMHEPIPLNMLSCGQSAHVVEVLGRSDLSQRLRELGIFRGVEIHMVRSGVPCIVRLANQTVCFRAEETSGVLVQPVIAG